MGERRPWFRAKATTDPLRPGGVDVFVEARPDRGVGATSDHDIYVLTLADAEALRDDLVRLLGPPRGYALARVERKVRDPVTFAEPIVLSDDEMALRDYLAARSRARSGEGS